jgi:hypothetical protein
MQSLRQTLHEAHKARLARFSAAAYAQPVAIMQPEPVAIMQPVVEDKFIATDQMIRDWLFVSSDPTSEEDIIFWRQAYPYIRGCSCPDKPRRIIAEVLLKHRAFWRDMTAGRRDRETVLCRHEICYRLRQETDYSMPRIGRLLGGRDHTTVIHGCRQHKIRMDAANR